jgi:hypothetical protein
LLACQLDTIYIQTIRFAFCTQDYLEDEELEALLQDAKAEKRRKKTKLQQWIAAFEEQHGRPPTKEDKQSIRHEFEEHKRLEQRIKQLQDYIAERQDMRKELEADAEAEFESSLDQTTTMALRLAPVHHEHSHERQPGAAHPTTSHISSARGRQPSARRDPTVREPSSSAATREDIAMSWTSDNAKIELADIQLHENELMDLYSTVIDINEDPNVQQWRAEISDLQSQVRATTMQPYHEEFKAEEDDGPLMISTVKPEWLEQHSKTVAQHRIQQAQEEFAAFKSKQAELIWKERNARQRVLQKEQELYHKLHKDRNAAYEKHRAHQQVHAGAHLKTIHEQHHM